MSKTVDRTLTVASVGAGLALVGAFVAGAMSGPDAGAVSPANPAAVDAGSDASPDAAPPDPASALPPPSTPADEPVEQRAANPAESPPSADPPPFRGTARVEVLNGAGRSGFAKAATTRLRDLGHDVVLFGNADRFDYARSEVIERREAPGAARAVADALGIADVRRDPDPALEVDATVILGADWVLPPAPEPAHRGLRGLLRRLLGGEPEG